MSAFSSPASLLTVSNNATPVQILSILKISSGLIGLFAPALYAQRAFGFTAHRNAGGVSVGASVGSNTTRAGSESEQAVAVRLTASRNIALGLLLRDSTAAVVVRALQVGVIVDLLDVLAAGLTFIEGNLSVEIASAVATISGVTAAYQLFLLNR